jgi:tripartite-type tricarboxylate transporter receptor subunit TctC
MEAGTIKILANADYERANVLPEVKTFKELGFDVSLPIWYSLCAPRKTPRGIVEKLSKAMQEIFNRYPEELREGLRRLEVSAAFHDSSDSAKKFAEDYIATLRIANELGVSAR